MQMKFLYDEIFFFVLRLCSPAVTYNLISYAHTETPDKDQRSKRRFKVSLKEIDNNMSLLLHLYNRSFVRLSARFFSCVIEQHRL